MCTNVPFDRLHYDVIFRIVCCWDPFRIDDLRSFKSFARVLLASAERSWRAPRKLCRMLFLDWFFARAPVLCHDGDAVRSAAHERWLKNAMSVYGTAAQCATHRSSLSRLTHHALMCAKTCRDAAAAPACRVIVAIVLTSSATASASALRLQPQGAADYVFGTLETAYSVLEAPVFLRALMEYARVMGACTVSSDAGRAATERFILQHRERDGAAAALRDEPSAPVSRAMRRLYVSRCLHRPFEIRSAQESADTTETSERLPSVLYNRFQQ